MTRFFVVPNVSKPICQRKGKKCLSGTPTNTTDYKTVIICAGLLRFDPPATTCLHLYHSNFKCD